VAGVTEQGFTTKTVPEITTNLNSRFTAAFGTQFDVSPTSPDGQCIGIMADVLGDIWEKAEAAYNAFSPSDTFGIGLDKVVELNGVTRITNRPTSVAVTFAGTTGTNIPAGYIIRTDDKLEFATVALATIPAVVTAVCKTQGAIKIIAGDVHVLSTTIPGLTSAVNLEPGITGIVKEEDPALRARREGSTISRGTNSVDAIYEAVRALNLPYIAIVENRTDAVVDGIPAKSFLTVVEGGTPQEVSKAIYDNKPQGAQAFGSIVTTINDSKGYPHYIGLSRPYPVDVSILMSISNKPGASIDSATLAQGALVDHTNGLNISEGVDWGEMVTATLATVPNIKVNSIQIKFTIGGAFAQQNLPITAQQRARTDASKVVVNVV